MGSDAKNGADVELITTWGRKTDNGATAAEREGR